MYQSVTIELIKNGFKRFLKEHGRLPTSEEVDKCGYLPSSRQIQRKFGGLENIRKELGYEDSHFGKGKFRSTLSFKHNSRGKKVERMLYSKLVTKFHEVFVHTEKYFNDSKCRVDFFIYCPEGDFAIDIFATETKNNLMKNINLKIDKYINITHVLYFVVDSNGIITQHELDNYLKSKVKSMPANSKLLTLESFISLIESKRAYPNPIK